MTRNPHAPRQYSLLDPERCTDPQMELRGYILCLSTFSAPVVFQVSKPWHTSLHSALQRFVICAIPSEAQAAVHEVSSSTTKVDCATFNGGVRAGYTIVLTGRTRGAASSAIVLGRCLVHSNTQ